MTTAPEFPRRHASGGAVSVRGLLAAITVVGAAVALGTPAAAHPLYDTESVLDHTENECLDLPKRECRTIASPRISLGAGAARTLELACAPKRPYVVAWDAEHHEHIRVTLVSDPPVDLRAGATAAAAAVEPESVTVLAANQADARGFLTLFIGCSAEPVVGAPFPRSRHGLPTEALRRAVEDLP